MSPPKVGDTLPEACDSPSHQLSQPDRQEPAFMRRPTVSSPSWSDLLDRRGGVTRDEQTRMEDLERENRELRRANEILRKAPESALTSAS